jgi:hypothetical protein
MKKALLILSLIVLIIGAKAQGNLQFNAVKRINTSIAAAAVSSTTAGTLTVPANKVWKIESGTISLANGAFPNASATTALHIDNQVLYSIAGTSSSFSSPIWLPEGTYSISTYNGLGAVQTFRIAISAIEFNIIP